MSNLPDFDQLWDYDDPEKTEKVFKDLVSETRSSGDHEYVAQLLTQIARTHSLRREFEEAHRILDDVEKTISVVATALDLNTPVARIRCFLERGRTYNSAGQIEKARPLFLEAWELARDAREDCHAVDAAHMLGICESKDASLIWNNKAMMVAEASDDPRAFEEIAECLLTLGRPNEARTYFMRAYQELSKDDWLSENESERLDRLKRLGDGPTC